jgi:hypothetical protein
MGPEHCLSVRFFSVDGVLLARFFSIDKVHSEFFFSADWALLARFSVHGVLLARFFSVEGVRSARSFSSDGVLIVCFSVHGVLLERFLSVDPALLFIVGGVLSAELFTDIRSIHSGWSGSFRLLPSSVPDSDPHVFGPPGSGSFYHQAKIVRKKP